MTGTLGWLADHPPHTLTALVALTATGLAVTGLARARVHRHAGAHAGLAALLAGTVATLTCVAVLAHGVGGVSHAALADAIAAKYGTRVTELGPLPPAGTVTTTGTWGIDGRPTLCILRAATPTDPTLTCATTGGDQLLAAR